MLDVIILSNAKTPELKSLTEQAINSCVNSIGEFNIIVIEQTKETYENCTVYHDSSEFNYNKFMNKGISYGKAEYIALCNNDIIFDVNWWVILREYIQRFNLLSACPVSFQRSGEIKFGYRNAHEISGYCIVIKRELLKIIGKLDESFPFWFADNVYSEQLKKHGIKHGIVCKSVVKHLGSKTLNTLTKDEQFNVTRKHIPEFIEKHPENESAIFFK